MDHDRRPRFHGAGRIASTGRQQLRRPDHIRREYLTEKSCAPYCTVSCVHMVSYFDFFRGKQTLRTEVPEHEKLVKITQSGQ